MNYKLVNQSGKKVKDLELNKKIFNIKPHEHAIHETIVSYLASIRNPIANTKGRSDVRGGGRKPYRQKGTGRARQGSIRAPHYKGGGVVFGPTSNVNYTKKVNHKVRKLAMKSALSQHVKNETLIIVDKVEVKDYKTKNMVKVLNSIGVKDNKALFLDKELNENLLFSARNIQNLKIAKVEYATVYDILNCDKLIITESALNYFEGVLK